jgi:hypothetical protein
MLRTNLSTRPFYNLRAVQVTIGALAVIVAAMTLGNIVEFVRLTASERDLGARAARAEEEAARLRVDARRIRGRINTRELTEVAEAAQEANAIIDLRTFSWSDLFAQLEASLPDDVRLTGFKSRVDTEGRFVVSVPVLARGVRDLETFLDALEKSDRFDAVLAAEERTNSEGLIDALIEGVYIQPPRPATPAPAASAAVPTGAAGE